MTESSPQLPTPGPPLDIVLIEADPDLRDVLTIVLVAAGHLVRAFGDADAAHAAVLTRVPDVVLTHLDLPTGLSASGFAERLRSEPRTRHVAIIVSTADVLPEYHPMQLFDAYLRKPMDTETILERTRTLGHVARARRG